MLSFFLLGCLVTGIAMTLFLMGFFIEGQFLFGPFIAFIIGLNYIVIAYGQIRKSRVPDEQSGN
ncbi:hypothetical protein [Bacillus suaedae]|uniref:Uncharacterized protein n=1 Tax=Halalkalibacter suaedae TaxID=2822140 RepID=A0A941ANU9_9BACI|nr:hypothetical protein [Bacillus suaedae]MBP3949498.1 hypothetical protein [Bacillus suaedae]